MVHACNKCVDIGGNGKRDFLAAGGVESCVQHAFGKLLKYGKVKVSYRDELFDS